MSLPQLVSLQWPRAAVLTTQMAAPPVTPPSRSFHAGTFNPTQIIIFIQGLFVTLVINRWSQIRALYAKIHSVTVEIAITACTFLQPPIKGQVAPEKIFMIRKARAKASASFARLSSLAAGPSCSQWHSVDASAPMLAPGRESAPPLPPQLARYLNLGHILTVMSADAQSKHFPVTRGVRFAAKHFKECLSGDLGGDMSKPEPEENAEGPSQLPTFGKVAPEARSRALREAVRGRGREGQSKHAAPATAGERPRHRARGLTQGRPADAGGVGESTRGVPWHGVRGASREPSRSGSHAFPPRRR